MNPFEFVVRAQDQASEVFQQIGEEGEQAGRLIDQAWFRITAAGTAAGGSAEAFARSQAEANASLERTAITTGATSDELREMAVAMSDHTFAASDAAAGMELLTQKGITTQEQFQEILPAVDDLADATGMDFPKAVDAADKMLAPFGQSLDDVGENSDQMTRLLNQTDIPLGTLERNLGRVPQELQALEFGLDDAAAGIQVFRDQGMTGQEAVREFRRAVEESEGDLGIFRSELGLSSEEWDEYVKSVEPAEGLTEDFAQANNDAMTPLQRMQATVQNLMFEYGHLAGTASELAPLLLAMGPAVGALSVAKAGLAAAAGLATAGVGGTAAALLAFAGPIAIVTALVAGLVIAWRTNFLGIQDHTDALLSFIEDRFGLDLPEIFTSLINSVREFTRQLGRQWQFFLEHPQDALDQMRAHIHGFLVDSLPNLVTDATDWAAGIVGTIVDAFQAATAEMPDILGGIRDAIVNFFPGAAVEAAQHAANFASGVVDTLSDAFTEAGPAVGDGLAAVGNAVTSFFTEAIPNAAASATAFAQGVMNGIVGAFQDTGSITEALGQIWNAYNGWIQDNITPAREAAIGFASDTIRSMASGFTENVGNIGDALSGVLDSVTGWFTENVETATSAASDFAGDVLGGITSAFEGFDVGESLNTVITEVETWFTENMESLQETASGFASDVLGGITSAFGEFDPGEAMNTIGDTFETWFTENMESLQTAASGFTSDVLGGITSAFGEFDPGEAIDAIGDAFTGWFDENMEGLQEAASGFTSDVLGGITSAFGEFDPSESMQALGASFTGWFDENMEGLQTAAQGFTEDVLQGVTTGFQQFDVSAPLDSFRSSLEGWLLFEGNRPTDAAEGYGQSVADGINEGLLSFQPEDSLDSTRATLEGWLLFEGNRPTAAAEDYGRSITGALADEMEEEAGRLESLLDGIQREVAETFELMQGDMEGPLEAVSDAFAQSQSDMIAWAATMGGTLPPAAQRAKNELDELANEFENELRPAIEDAVEETGSFKEAMEDDDLQTALSDMEERVGALRDVLKEYESEGAGPAIDSTRELQDALGETSDPLDEFLDRGRDAAEWYRDVFPLGIGIAGRVLQTFGGRILTIAGRFLGWFGVAMMVKDFLSGDLQEAIVDLGGWLDDLAESVLGVETPFEDMAQWVADLVEPIREELVAWLQDAAETVSDFLDVVEDLTGIDVRSWFDDFLDASKHLETVQQIISVTADVIERFVRMIATLSAIIRGDWDAAARHFEAATGSKLLDGGAHLETLRDIVDTATFGILTDMGLLPEGAERSGDEWAGNLEDMREESSREFDRFAEDTERGGTAAAEGIATGLQLGTEEFTRPELERLMGLANEVTPEMVEAWLEAGREVGSGHPRGTAEGITEGQEDIFRELDNLSAEAIALLEEHGVQLEERARESGRGHPRGTSEGIREGTPDVEEQIGSAWDSWGAHAMTQAERQEELARQQAARAIPGATREGIQEGAPGVLEELGLFEHSITNQLREQAERGEETAREGALGITGGMGGGFNAGVPANIDPAMLALMNAVEEPLRDTESLEGDAEEAGSVVPTGMGRTIEELTIIGQAFDELFAFIAARLVEAQAEIGQEAEAVAEAFREALADGLIAAGETWLETWATIQARNQEGVNAVLSDLNEWSGSIQNGFTHLRGQITPLWATTWAELESRTASGTAQTLATLQGWANNVDAGFASTGATVTASWQNTWNQVQAATAAGTAAVLATLQGWSGNVQNGFATVGNAMQSTWQGTWGQVQGITTAGTGSVMGTLQGWAGQVQGAFANVSAQAQGVWSALWNALAGTTASQTASITGQVQAMASTVQGAIQSAASGMQGTWANAWNSMASATQNAASRIERAATSMARSVESSAQSVARNVQNAQRQAANMPTGGVAAMATGGRALGGLTLVGEHGPELVNLPAGAHVSDHMATVRKLEGMIPHFAHGGTAVNTAQNGGMFEGLGAQLRRLVALKRETLDGVHENVQRGRVDSAIRSFLFDWRNLLQDMRPWTHHQPIRRFVASTEEGLAHSDQLVGQRRFLDALRVTLFDTGNMYELLAGNLNTMVGSMQRNLTGVTSNLHGVASRSRELRAMESGGVTRGGLTLVGERGPELVSRGGARNPDRERERREPNITITQNIHSPRPLNVQEMRRQTERVLRRAALEGRNQ